MYNIFNKLVLLFKILKNYPKFDFADRTVTLKRGFCLFFTLFLTNDDRIISYLRISSTDSHPLPYFFFIFSMAQILSL